MERSIGGGAGTGAVADCARVSTGEVMMRGPGLPKPELSIVHDYQVSWDEVQLDNGIASRSERLVQGESEEQDRVKLELSGCLLRAGGESRCFLV